MHKYEPERRGLTSLESLLPRIGITKRTLKKLEGIQLIRDQRDQNKQELAYHARPFVLCGIPLRRPSHGQAVHTRRNGRFFLEITAHPRFALPYGQARLIPIWVATLALKQRSRVVHFDSAAEMLDFFRLPKDGLHYRRIVQGFQRIFAATIFFGSEDQPDGPPVMDWSRFHFFDRIQLWFNQDHCSTARDPESRENVITLSEAFYGEIDDHRIPVELEVVAALAHAPGALDFYIWIVWKSWTVNGNPARIPLFANQGLEDQLGASNYSLDRYFRRKISAWLRQVKVLWPDCPATISKDRRFLIVPSSKRVPAVRCIQ